MNIISAGAKRAAYSGVPRIRAWYSPKIDKRRAAPAATYRPVRLLSSCKRKSSRDKHNESYVRLKSHNLFRHNTSSIPNVTVTNDINTCRAFKQMLRLKVTFQDRNYSRGKSQSCDRLSSFKPIVAL